MFLKEIKLTDLDPDKKYDVLVPIGSTEQHGPYIPFGTDTYLTDTVVKEIDVVFPKLLILPTLEYSCSKEHEGFLGTLWLEEKTLKNILNDICSSMENLASSIIFFTEHGGNMHVIRDFINKRKSFFKAIPLHHLITDDAEIDRVAAKIVKGPIDGHAGNSEISLMLSLYPNLTTIPKKGGPKTPINWTSHRLKEQSDDGIADPHPEWIVNKKLGDLLVKVMKDSTIKNLKKILAK